jgi:hypothetical protein
MAPGARGERKEDWLCAAARAAANAAAFALAADSLVDPELELELAVCAPANDGESVTHAAITRP